MRGKEHIRNVFLLGLLIFCYVSGVLMAYDRSSDARVNMLYYDSIPINGTAASKMYRQEAEQEKSLQFTFWRSEQSRYVTNDELGKSAETELLILYGSSELLLPEEPVLYEDEQDGCLISADICYQLFGSYAYSEGGISIQGSEYRVKGLIESAESVVVIQGDRGSDTVYNRAALLIPAGRAAAQETDKFMAKYGPADYTLDMALYRNWERTLISVLPLCMIGSLLIAAAKGIRRRKEGPAAARVKEGAAAVRMLKSGPAAVWVLKAGTALAVVLYIWALEVKIPLAGYIAPSRWSDFSYWRRLTEQIGADLQHMFLETGSAVERLALNHLLQIGTYVIISLFLFLLLVRQIRCDSAARLLSYCSSSFVLTYGCIYVLAMKGIYYTANRSIWLLMILYLICRYLVTRLTVGSWPFAPDRQAVLPR